MDGEAPHARSSRPSSTTSLNFTATTPTEKHPPLLEIRQVEGHNTADLRRIRADALQDRRLRSRANARRLDAGHGHLPDFPGSLRQRRPVDRSLWRKASTGASRSCCAGASAPKHPPLGRDFFGGDLRGVIDHLDYLADLGIDSHLLHADLRRADQPPLRRHRLHEDRPDARHRSRL